MDLVKDVSGFEHGVILGYQFLKFQLFLRKLLVGIQTRPRNHPRKANAPGVPVFFLPRCRFLILHPVLLSWFLSKNPSLQNKNIPQKKRTGLDSCETYTVLFFLGTPQAANFPWQLLWETYHQLLQPRHRAAARGWRSLRFHWMEGPRVATSSKIDSGPWIQKIRREKHGLFLPPPNA